MEKKEIVTTILTAIKASPSGGFFVSLLYVLLIITLHNKDDGITPSL
jgi:hypothetical protein